MANVSGRDVDTFYREADAFRREMVEELHKLASGAHISMKTSQDLLMAEIRLLIDVAFFLEDYSMKIQGKPLQVIDASRFQVYSELLRLARKIAEQIQN